MKLVVHLVLLHRVKEGNSCTSISRPRHHPTGGKKKQPEKDTSRSSKPAVRGVVLSETDVNVGGPLSPTTRRQAKNHRSSERKRSAGRTETAIESSTWRQQKVEQQLRRRKTRCRLKNENSKRSGLDKEQSGSCFDWSVAETNQQTETPEM